MFHYAFPVLVHNQCSDFELVSPAYFGRNVIWHIPPDQKVTANTMTKTSFGRNIVETEFASALVYKLQRKKRPGSNDQSNADSTSAEDTLINLQLLVIWKSNDECSFSVRALLIKHSNIITWDEGTLEKLHSMYLALLNKGLLIDTSAVFEEASSVVSEEDSSIVFEADPFVVEDTWLLDDVTVLITASKWKEENREIEITISEGTRKDDSMEPLWVSSNM
jgi:hypothetical protein